MKKPGKERSMALGKKKTEAEELADLGISEEEIDKAYEEAQADGKIPGGDKSKIKVGKKNVTSFFPEYEYPGVKPQDEKELKAWKKKVKDQRKKLKAALKKAGIYQKGSSFEQTAFELGLSTDNGKKAGILLWLKWAFLWLKTKAGMRALIGIGVGLLALLFLVSYLTELAGSFTINLTADMQRAGFILSETSGFEKNGSRLFSDRVEQINNITLEEVVKDVDEHDGAHNGSQYIAYTFYIKNNGKEPADYKYTLKMVEATMGVDKAVWIMLFEDGHQVIYAAPSSDGDEERLFGYATEPPFYETALDQNSQYYERNGYWGLATTSFVGENIVVQGMVEDVEPGTAHKYTIVVWLEGNDPECTDDIFGGYAKYSMDFSILDEANSDSIFSGVWRTEYDDYADGMIDIEKMDEEEEETEEETTKAPGESKASDPISGESGISAGPND